MKCSGCDREATRILVDRKTAESLKLGLDRPGTFIEFADPKACKAFCNDCWDVYLGKPKPATITSYADYASTCGRCGNIVGKDRDKPEFFYCETCNRHFKEQEIYEIS